MSTYVIGDVQGCYDELINLIKKIKFNPKKDNLIFAGDLINRGPKSLETLRYIKSLGANTKTVLGNHDLHLINIIYGYNRPSSKDTIQDICKAHDKIELIEWLRHQPILIKKNKHLIVHAGIAPNWSMKKSINRAHELESILRSDTNIHLFLKNMYGNEPDIWDKHLEGSERWRCIANYFTRMRFCLPNGSMDLTQKGDLNTSSKELIPWFDHPKFKISADTKVLFGHWASLKGNSGKKNVIALDTGCVWGGKLMAYCIEEKKYITINA